MATKKTTTKTKKTTAKKPKVKLSYKTTPEKESCTVAGSELHAKDKHKQSIAGTVLGKCSGKSRAKKATAKKKMYKRAGIEFV